MVDNPNKYSEMGTGSSLGDIRDDDDFPHAGIIKALSDGLGQNYAISGFAATNISATSVDIAAGKIMRDGKIVDVAGATLTIAAGSGSTGNTYSILVAPASGAITRIQGTVKNKTPTVPAGNTIVGVLVHTGSNPMQLQYLTVDKSENHLSVAWDNGGTYTEVGTLTGDTNGITMTGLYKLDALPAATVAGADKIIIQDSDDSDKIKTVTATSVASLATGISNIVEDTSPQLGGNLDANGNNILIDNGNFIGDENGLEQIKFATTASAVNEITVTNAATGNGPTIESTGDNTDIDLNIKSKGTTSQVKINDNMALDNGYIQIGTQDSSLVVGGSGTSAGYDLLVSAGSTSKGSNNLDGGDLILKSGGGDGTGTSVMTFFTKVDGTDDTAERMRIDTLGNLLVGGTGVSSTKLGIVGAVGARAYHGAITEFTGNGLTGTNNFNLDASAHRTVITRSSPSIPNPPNNVAIQCPASATIVGWECRILCRENAGGADDTFLFTQGSDEIQDITGAVLANSSGTTTSLTAGKAYDLICIGSNTFILYQIN
jgi:hypothetical protein